MTFESYRDSIINDFVEDCKHCKTMNQNQELTEEQLLIIEESFEEHRQCFESEYDNAINNNEELITSMIYGDSESASIECLNCNSIIIDDESLFI